MRTHSQLFVFSEILGTRDPSLFLPFFCLLYSLFLIVVSSCSHLVYPAFMFTLVFSFFFLFPFSVSFFRLFSFVFPFGQFFFLKRCASWFTLLGFVFSVRFLFTPVLAHSDVA